MKKYKVQLVGLSVMCSLFMRASQAQSGQVISKWAYDPDYRPIPKQEIIRTIQNRTTTAQEHEQLIYRAWINKSLDFAVEEYIKQGAIRMSDAPLQSAFGYAYFLAESRPSDTPLYKAEHRDWNYFHAIAALRRGAKLSPESPFAWRALAYAGISKTSPRREDIEEDGLPSMKQSFEYLDKAINLKPNDARTYRMLVWGYSFLSKYADKEKMLNAASKAVQFTPKSSVALQGLASAYFVKHDYKLAYSWLQKSYALRPPQLRDASLLSFYAKLAGETKTGT